MTIFCHAQFFYITIIYQFSVCFSFDELTPYIYQHGSGLTHQDIQNCHQQGNVPYETYHAHMSNDQNSKYVEVKRFLKVFTTELSETIVRGHYAVISDPTRTISVLEPSQKHGCSLNLRETVAETARLRNCEVAINAGFFDTKSGLCLGNVISDGYLAHNSKGIQNAHFGLTKDNKIFMGYVPESAVKENSNFLQLVGGVVWVVRNGSGFVNNSKYLECEKTEETGSMSTFVNTVSSRTLIGHDSNGKVVILQIDGKTFHYGMSLWQMEKLAKELGLINAINLDGGGSSTFVINGTTANYPSDECSPNSSFSCERKVSTIICVHPPVSKPYDYSDHCKCKNGVCSCDKPLPHCKNLSCPTYCTSKGNCTVGECRCLPRFCSEICGYTDNCTASEISKTDFNIVFSSIKSFLPYIIAFSALISGITVASLLLLFYSCSCSCKSQQRFCRKRRRHRYMDLQSLTGFPESSDDEHTSVHEIK